MAKLNKSTQWELIQEAITNVVNNTDTLKKNQEENLEAELINALNFLAPKTGGGSSTKVDANGNVYCNYFQDYRPAEAFKTKMSKPNKTTGERTEVYKANCIDAELILRQIKTTRTRLEKQVMENFMDKTISADEMEKFLNNADELLNNTHYETPGAVPTVTEILAYKGGE